MAGIQYLAFLWTLLITHTPHVCGDIQFLERQEGESVLLPCAVEQGDPFSFGMYLKRSWLHPTDVLFMYTGSEFSTGADEDKNRISVSGDPSSHALNVTISQLKASDTDRYYCEFVVENPAGEDLLLLGKTEFFLLVRAGAPGPVDVGLVETCAGGSAVLPCLPLNTESLAVEGVSLKRQRGRAPVEVVYHSKLHNGSSSQFPAERVQLSSAPGPGGITYNLSLQGLQPDDSGLYSCQLLLRGRPDSPAGLGLGRQVFFLSVQGGECGCSSYSTLLYVLSSAVAILFLLLLLLLLTRVVIQGKSRRRTKSQSQAPIYEEMARAKATRQRLAPQHLEGKEASESKNCLENHYETPRRVLCPRKEPQEHFNL